MQATDLYGGIYSPPGSWGWGYGNPLHYWVYVDYYTTANDASTSDMLVEFAGRSYWDSPNAGQDCITILRFKSGNPQTGIF